MSSLKSKSGWNKKIIHIDMDAFYASVEQRDHPEYRGKPVVVGGSPESRGVVSTASYEARKFGVHSAMPSAQAKRLCPHAVFLRPHFEKYSRESQSIMSILRQHTDLVEPVSMDEAYLDVTVHKFGIDDPSLIASMIRQNIQAVTNLTASAGVAPNLFLAKVASDMNKPDGLTVIHPRDVIPFLENLPVRKIPGVGPVTEKELHRLRLKTCGDLQRAGKIFLGTKLGRTGLFLHRRACGLDDRCVEPHSESKQYSAEETFEKDTRDKQMMEQKLAEFSEQIFIGLKNEGRMGKTVVLKVKYFDFESITRSKTITHYPNRWEDVCLVARELLNNRTLAGKKPVRLLGLGISGLKPVSAGNVVQRDLFERV